MMKPAELPTRARQPLPPGAADVNMFSLYNAVSWQIVIGPPIVLYASTLHASSTVLGLLGALMPLLTVFQIPAAKHLPKYGYRRFILAGWGTRIFFIGGMAAVPLLTFLSPAIRLWLVVVLLSAFNFVRGVTSGAWMPWMTELIPERIRGRFLSRDQFFSQAGGVLTLLAASLVLWGRHPRPWQFSLIFLISIAGALASLMYIRRVPDVTTPETIRSSGHRVPWMSMIAYRPFLMLIVFNLLYAAAVAGLVVFTTAYLKEQAHLEESWVIWLAVLVNVGSLVAAMATTRLVDGRGSRFALAAAMLIFAGVTAGWWAIAGGMAHHSVALVVGLNLIFGAAQSVYSVANSRLQMSTVPLMGRNHFFALYTVITSLGMALSPILWGMILDMIGPAKWGGGVQWNRYSLYFALAGVLAVAAMLSIAWLHEGEQKSVRGEVAEVP
ncbi:MAG: MFS transporter [Tepidisphaerales bacterium]